MESQQIIIDKGLFITKNSIKILDSYETVKSLLRTIKEYRDYYQPGSVNWENYIHDFMHIFKFKLEEIAPRIIKMGDFASDGNPLAILAIISPEDEFAKINHDIEWGLILYFVANYYKVKYGVVTNGLKLIIYNFEISDYLQSYFWVNFDEVIKNGVDDCFYKVFSVFSMIKSQSRFDKITCKEKVIKILSKSSDNGTLYDLNYHFNNTQRHTVDLFERLRSKIFNLSDSIEERYNKLYVSYSMDKNFCEIHFQSNRLKIWVNACIDEIQDPMHLCRDMRNIGHYGNGESELFLERIEDLDNVFEIIEQSFKICIDKYGVDNNLSMSEVRMNKYQGLFEYLTNLPSTQSSVTLSFFEIEELIGSKLPPSARVHRPWWANEIVGRHSQRLAWMEAGWLVDAISFITESATFKRG